MARLSGDRVARAPSGGYTIDQTALVQRLEAAIDKPQMLDALDHLSNAFTNRYHAHPVGIAAAHWIRDQWLALAAGREDVTVELFEHTQTNQPSVILTIDGADLPDEVVILGGHLDSYSWEGNTGDPDYLAPGADDDASGIIVLNEVIRVAMAISTSAAMRIPIRRLLLFLSVSMVLDHCTTRVLSAGGGVVAMPCRIVFSVTVLAWTKFSK